MQLRILILGAIPSDLRRDLALLCDGVELVEADPLEADPASVLSERPHLLVLGEAAPFSARAIHAPGPSPDDAVPILAVGPDPGADLRLPDRGLGRDEVLRLALRFARMRRALSSSREDVAATGAGTDVRDASDLFRQRLEYEFSRALRYRHPVSLVTVCVDGPERLASMYGVAAVTAFVSTLEGTLRRCLRDIDLLFRSGVDEISAILPETPADAATFVADRFLTQTSRLVFKPTTPGTRAILPLKTTSSIGVADGPGEGVRTPQDLLDLARGSMASARLAGGGRIVVHGLQKTA